MAFAREQLPPGFASTNEFAMNVDSLSNWSTVICQPHQPERVYYGLYGGELQAEYDVSRRHAIFYIRVCPSCLVLVCAQKCSVCSLLRVRRLWWRYFQTSIAILTANQVTSRHRKKEVMGIDALEKIVVGGAHGGVIGERVQ